MVVGGPADQYSNNMLKLKLELIKGKYNEIPSSSITLAHCKCSGATRGWGLPYWTAQMWNMSTVAESSGWFTA